jgi:hypothetical protein
VRVYIVKFGVDLGVSRVRSAYPRWPERSIAVAAAICCRADAGELNLLYRFLPGVHA